MVRQELSHGNSAMLGGATVSVPGTCGELVQGVVDGIAFHVTCPVDLYSTVSVEMYRGPRFIDGPEDCPKTVEAVSRTLNCLSQNEIGVKLRVASSLPRGKGMASSTADIVAAVEATTRALDKTLSAEEVARIALSVEPSDGTMFPGIAIFDHREGKITEMLGPPLPVDILVLDFGGVVDTLEFNGGGHIQRLKEVEPQTRYALDLARQGIQKGDPALIGRAATISAMANQGVLFRPQLEAVMDIAQASGALGVNVAHSGTVIGVLLDARSPAEKMSQGILERVSRDVSGLEKHYLLRLTGGGVKDVGSGD